MVYGADRIVQMPVMQLYDTGLMQSAVNNARYMYEKAEKRMDDFYEKYGEFMSPFLKDMERYNQIVGNIKNVVDNLYATGEDPLRTASGRVKMAAALRSVNPAEFAAMKSNAKMGYAYLDALQKLRSQGKYSDALELFDITHNGGTRFQDFATRGETGFNTWDRISPVQAVSLRDLTQEAYKGRTARLLSQADFNDPRLRGKYKFDPRYEWSGYLYSDLLKGAPGASLAIAGDPRAAFFRNEARNRVIAAGLEPNERNVEAQFRKDIADANTWALIDPSRTVNEYSKMATANAYTQSNIRLQHDLAAAQKQKDHENAMELQRLKNEGKYPTGKGGVFKYGQATQDQAIMSLVNSLVGTMQEKDANGNVRSVTVDNARKETVYEAFRSKVLTPYRKFMRELWNSNRKNSSTSGNGDANEGVYGNNAFLKFLSKFGYIDTEGGFEASMGKKLNEPVKFSAADINHLYTDAELLAMSDGYKKMKSGWTHKDEIERVLRNRKGSSFGGSDIAKLYGENGNGIIEGIKGSSKNPNKIPVIMPDGSMVMFRAVNVKYGDKNAIHNTGRLWIPVGSPTLPKDYVNTKKGTRIGGLNPYNAEQNALQQIEEDARYLQFTGSQKNQNIGLPGEIEEEEPVDVQALYEYILNGGQ